MWEKGVGVVITLMIITAIVLAVKWKNGWRPKMPKINWTASTPGSGFTSSDWAKIIGSASGAVATIVVAFLLTDLVRDTIEMQYDRMKVDSLHIAEHKAITADVSSRPHIDTVIAVSKGDTVKFFLPRYRSIAITPETADRYAIRIERFDGTKQILEHDPRVRHVELPHPIRTVEVIGKSDKPVRVHLSTE